MRNLLLLVLVLGMLTGCGTKDAVPPQYGCEDQMLCMYDRVHNDPRVFMAYVHTVNVQEVVVVTQHMNPDKGGERMTIAIKNALKNKGLHVEELPAMPQEQKPDVLYVHPLCLRKTDNALELQFMTVTRFSLNQESIVYDLVGVGRYKPSMLEAVGGLTASIVAPFAFAGQGITYRAVYGERAAHALRQSYEAFYDGTYQSPPELPITTCIQEL